MKTISKVNWVFIVIGWIIVGFGDVAYSKNESNGCAILPSAVYYRIDAYLHASVNAIAKISSANGKGYFVDASTVHADELVRYQILSTLADLAIVFKDKCFEAIAGLNSDEQKQRSFERMALVKIAALHYMLINPNYDSKLYVIQRLVGYYSSRLKQFLNGIGVGVGWRRDLCNARLLNFLKQFPLLSTEAVENYTRIFNGTGSLRDGQKRSEMYRTRNEKDYLAKLEEKNDDEPSYQMLIKNEPFIPSAKGPNDVATDDGRPTDKDFGSSIAAQLETKQNYRESSVAVPQSSVDREKFEQEDPRCADFWVFDLE